ncbi:unnamed protein product [Lepidochelys kempii]
MITVVSDSMTIRTEISNNFLPLQAPPHLLTESGLSFVDVCFFHPALDGLCETVLRLSSATREKEEFYEWENVPPCKHPPGTEPAVCNNRGDPGPCLLPGPAGSGLGSVVGAG